MTNTCSFIKIHITIKAHWRRDLTKQNKMSHPTALKHNLIIRWLKINITSWWIFIFALLSYLSRLGSEHTDLCQLTGAQKTFNTCEDLHNGFLAFQKRVRLFYCVKRNRFFLSVALTNVHVVFFLPFLYWLNWVIWCQSDQTNQYVPTLMR